MQADGGEKRPGQAQVKRWPVFSRRGVFIFAFDARGQRRDAGQRPKLKLKLLELFQLAEGFVE